MGNKCKIEAEERGGCGYYGRNSGECGHTLIGGDPVVCEEYPGVRSRRPEVMMGANRFLIMATWIGSLRRMREASELPMARKIGF